MPEYLVSGPNSVAYQLPHFWQVLKALETRSHVKVTITINYNTTCRREGWTLQRDIWNFGGVEDMFIISIMMMATQVCTYVKTQQIRYFTCSLLHIDYTSIQVGKKDLQKCKTVPHLTIFFLLKSIIAFH